MQFKETYHTLSTEQMAELYRTIQTISRDRVTDLNEPSIRFILESIDPAAKTLLDVGCGNGYFLKRAKKQGLEVHGCDVFDQKSIEGMAYTQGDITRLPFADNAFDVVTCNHTIEHIPDLERAIAELKRVAKKQVIISTPCQRPFFYTLDLHVHFFPYKASLERVMQMPRHVCKKLWGDWVYVGNKTA